MSLLYKTYSLRLPLLISCSSLIFSILSTEVAAQQYYMQQDGNPSVFWDVFVDCYGPNCARYDVDYTISPDKDRGLTLTPSGKMYGMDDYSFIYEIDTSSGNYILVLPTSNQYYLDGLAAVSDSIIYSIDRAPSPDTLVRINILTGTITTVRHLQHYTYGDLALFDGVLYYIGSVPVMDHGLISIDLNDTSDHGTWILDIPSYRSIHGISATRQCYMLIGADDSNEQFITINFKDGVIEDIGEMPHYNQTAITGLVEFEPPQCLVALDLDCDNSSGAIVWDYNAIDYTCLSEGISISDDDVCFLYDTFIDQLTVSLVGFIPDGTNEFLEIGASPPGISITGSGTQFITMTNTTGTTPSSAFKQAIRQITYHNTSLFPTPGERTIEAQFITYTGAQTDLAIAHLVIVEYAPYPLDLGDDLTVCEGENISLTSNITGVQYSWSTGNITPSIGINESGQYSLTITGSEYCAAADTVEVTFLPLIHVDMPEEIMVCDSDDMFLTIQTDSDIPLVIEILATPGGPFTLNNITGIYQHPINPVGTTYYFIQSVTSAQPSCIDVENNFLAFEVYPTYFDSVATGICEGDSFLINNTWVSEPGYYTAFHQTSFGCDSITIHHISSQSFLAITEHYNTCNTADTGTIVTHLNNPDGCDTLLTRIIHYAPLDTTWINDITCRKVDEGIFLDVLIAGNGCDSLVITTLTSIPSDTSEVYSFSCDSASLGTSEQILPNADGCDSLVISHFLWGSSDTSFVNTTSCDSASLGIFEEHYSSQIGCDSVVFTTVSYSSVDSIFIQNFSCDPSQVGTTATAYVNRFGCDSIVTIRTDLLETHEMHVSLATCNENAAGIFTDSLTNQFGCDSIIITYVELLPSHETVLYGMTCQPAEAGQFVTTHLNQFGCDSIVTTTIEFFPSDTTTTHYKTCNPDDVGYTTTMYTNQAGCDSLVVEITELNPLPQLDLLSSAYNGYQISCFGENDGMIHAQVLGSGPFEYQWSTGLTDEMITGLTSGIYSIMVTDANGCTTSGEIHLLEPDDLSIATMITHPDCFDVAAGSISIDLSGGVEPVSYSLDGIHYQSSATFENLTGGTYEITAMDANGCEVKEILWINVPLPVNVELGDDRILQAGDMTTINAIVNIPFDSLASVQWNGLADPDCPQCLAQPVAPVVTTTYLIQLTTLDGCTDEDAMTLFVEKDHDIFIPSIFTPNGDGANDVLFIYSGQGVREISTFVIFDRWGNLVFEKNSVQPNDPYYGWDGTIQGSKANPGVFAYLLIVEFKDGTTKALYGDVTLIR